MSSHWDDPTPLTKRALAGYAVAAVGIATLTATVVSSFFVYLNSTTREERDALRDSVRVIRARNEAGADTLKQARLRSDSLLTQVRTLNENAGNCGRWYTLLRARVDTLTTERDGARRQVSALWEAQQLDRRWQDLERAKNELTRDYQNNNKPQLLPINEQRIQLIQQSQDRLQERIKLVTQQACQR